MVRAPWTCDNVKNDTVVTLIPIHDILKGKQPGAYVLIAQDAAKANARATTRRAPTSSRRNG